MILLLPSIVVAGPICEPFCGDTPCSDLNGNVEYECGTCPPSAACHPGAPGFGPLSGGVAEVDNSAGASPALVEPEEKPYHDGNVQTLPSDVAAGFDATLRQKHLLFASEGGVSRVAFDCTGSGDIGEWLEPDGARRGLRREGGSFSDVPASAAVRMAALCAASGRSESIDAGNWELCVQSDPTGEKPKGVLNRTCALERHRHFWGEAFAPFEVGGDGPSPPAGHKQRFGEQGQRRVALPEVVGCLDAATFFAKHVDIHTPVIMRGCANASNAMALSLWTDEHLLAVAPDHSTERDSCKTPLRDFLSKYRDGEHPYRRCNNLPAALLSELNVHPFLDVEEDQPSERDQGNPRMKFENVLLWMHGGTSDQMSRLHFDMNGVILTQIDGTKHWLAVDPGESVGLYSDFNHDPFVNTSPLNEQAIDLLEHPRAAHVTLHVGVTRPGDIVYMPTRWWHVVRSPPAPRGAWRRNLAFTVEISTRAPRHAFAPMPSYVHRPAYTHELMLWARSYRGPRASPPPPPEESTRATGRRTMGDVTIQMSGSCTAAKMGLEEPPLGVAA